jgi:hypothetical protein
MRPLFRHPQQPPVRRRVQRPLMPSLRPDDRPSCLRPLIEPQQRLFPVLHLRPEQHPALASQQSPFLLPQQPLHSRLHQAPQQHPLLPPQRRLLQPLQQANQQQPSLLLQQHTCQSRLETSSHAADTACPRGKNPPARASGVAYCVTGTWPVTGDRACGGGIWWPKVGAGTELLMVAGR